MNSNSNETAEGASLSNVGLGVVCEHGQLKRSCLICEKDTEIDRLREALRLSTNGLRHCSRWNISEEKEKAIMTQVIANEAILTPNV